MTKKASVMLLVLLIFMSLLTACKKKEEGISPLVGSWEGTDNSITYIYNFMENGTGNTVVSYADMSDSFEFDWKTEDATLSLTFKEGDSTHTQDFGFEIKDNSLTLTYEENTMTLTKK